MASTSSSMASSHPDHTKYDVFLSFRGEDTRHSFTDHLYTALKRAAIHTFRDDDDIRRGQDLAPELVKAIKSSKASIVVLSENYAKSRWCLEELSLILEQKRKGNHFVLPVFYKVNPSDVRNQRQSFAIEGSKWAEVNVSRWKSALREVANLTGMVASGSETEFISNIVGTIDNELDSKLLSISANLIGMETRAKDIECWLKDEHSDTNVLAICGMGGSKTTLAQHIYNSNKHNFESSSFLEEIGRYFKETSGLLGKQKQLLTAISGGMDKTISCVAEGAAEINEVLRRKKVLIVLDDIDENDELEALLGTSVIHTQSKVIITTRLLDIDSWFESISWMCRVTDLKLLNEHESLELFCCHAFGSKLPLDGFNDLAVELAHCCGGNPLALKVLGSSLFVSEKDLRERTRIMETWRSRLNSLRLMKGDLDNKIQGVLQKSFNSLPHPNCKELFLHIAVFFVGEDEDYVANILEHDFQAKARIMTLVNRCLLTISPNKKLVMHQLIQDMGRYIVCEYSKDPAKHTRVWCSDEASRLLKKGDGSERIEGLTLDVRMLKKGTKENFQALAIKTSSLAKMHKLKLLQLKYVKIKGHYKNIPELRWLCWHGCHLKTVPSGLFMSRFLVAIDMTGGNLEKFESPTVLMSLKILNLKYCVELVSIRKLNRLPNLETLILRDCWNLIHICETIQGLENLTLLNLAKCNKLWNESWNKKLVNQHKKLKAICIGGEIPEQLLFSLPKSLKFIFLDYCNIEYHNDLRVSFNGLLLGMSLEGNLFEFIPTNIDLRMLRVLNLDYCINLKSILSLPCMLEELYTYNCKSLEKVTFQSGRFGLRKFVYKDCFKLSEVEGLFKLMAIKELHEADLGHMKWIKTYEDHKVDLVCDQIPRGRSWHIQMLYEYGIRSTYLQGVKDRSMFTHEHTSSSHFLSFLVSLHPKKNMIHELSVCFLYRSSGSTDKDSWSFFIKISNITTGFIWVYNPFVYCKPKVDDDTMWLSYWPIGNMLHFGDEVSVSMHMEEGMIVTECGASLVYMDDGEVEHEENWESKAVKMEEVIGGELSEFELATSIYYLCRHDIFKSSTPEWLKGMFGDTINHNRELQGWRKSYQSQYLDASGMQLKYVPELHRDTLYKEIWLGYLNKETNIRKIKKAVLRLAGVNFVGSTVSLTYTDKKVLYVLGGVDSMEVETCVKEFEKTIRIIDVNYNTNRLKKLYYKEMQGKLNTCIKSLKKQRK